MMFVGVNVTFFPMHFAGLRGMPRRIYTYPGGMGWDWLNMVETIGAGIFAIGMRALSSSTSSGATIAARSAGNNPWNASSLEWSTTSPPPEYNFEVIPVVRSRDPLWDTPELSETGAVPRVSRARRQAADARHHGARRRPREVLRMPGDSLWPLFVALALAGLFTALLFARLGTAAMFGAFVLAGAGRVALAERFIK